LDSTFWVRKFLSALPYSYSSHYFLSRRFSEDFNAALLLLGVETVEDLPLIYDDVLMLESFQAQVPKEDFDKFLQARDCTVVLLRSPALALPRPPSPVQRGNNHNNDNTLPITPIHQQIITEQSSTSIQDLSVDVKNSDNSVRRWETALATYSQQNENGSGSTNVMNEGGPSRSQGRVVLNALIDISGSMQGTKLIAVKLGLSALISQLEDNDVMNITSFSDRSHSITGGFQTIGSLKRILPVLLNALLDDGSTAFFDAVIEGIRHLRHYSQGRVVLNDSNTQQQTSNNNPNNVPVVVITPEEKQKCIVIALTDGEDNASRYSSPHILYRLSNPGINNFMFVLLAVDMGENEERTFRSWMELRYCKQISVNIRSGSKLVQIFKEVLINRILMTDVNNARFYQFNNTNSNNNDSNPITNVLTDNSITPPAVAAVNPPIIDFDRDDENLIMNYQAASAQQVFQTLRTDLLRQHNNNTNNNNTRMRTGDEDEEDDGNGGNLSRAVSRCNSECDFNIHDDNNNNNNNINYQDMIDIDYPGSDD
jgi:hypothetical protein